MRSIAVMGVVDDPNYRMNGDKPFVDVVRYWPTREQWTITHVCRADKDADDFPVRVRCWQPIVELPPPWSALAQRSAKEVSSMAKHKAAANLARWPRILNEKIDCSIRPIASSCGARARRATPRPAP